MAVIKSGKLGTKKLQFLKSSETRGNSSILISCHQVYKFTLLYLVVLTDLLAWSTQHKPLFKGLLFSWPNL